MSSGPDSISKTERVPPKGISGRTLIERGGKRERRIEVAQNAREVAQLQLMNTVRTLVMDVESAFVDVQLAKENLSLARDNLRAFQEIVDIKLGAGPGRRSCDGRAAPGPRGGPHVSECRTPGGTPTTDRPDAIAALNGPPSRLGNVRHLRGPAARSVHVGLPELQQQAMRLRPDLNALQREQARTLADLRLQIAQGKVDFTVGTEYHRQYGYVQGNSMGFFFSAPLPVFNRNQGEIERARREQQQIQARIRALEADIQTEVENAYQQYVTARDLLESIERDMLAQAKRRPADYGIFVQARRGQPGGTAGCAARL